MMPDTIVALVLLLLIVVAFVAAAARHLRVPYTVALVLAGLVLALVPGMPHIDLTPSLILTLFLPIVLFYGAYTLDVAALRANLIPLVTLAFPGVLLTAALVGTALHLIAGVAWTEAFLFGAIVSATDPVAVLAIFGEVGVPRRLATLVMGESLFNDGTALVLFVTILGIATTHTVDLRATFLLVLLEVLGGIVLGVGVGLLGSLVVQRIDDALLETTITLILAYGGYLLATALHSSGPLETVTAAIAFGARGQTIMSPSTRLQARAIWEFLDFLVNSFLFLLIGLALRSITELPTALGGQSIWWPLFVAIVAVVASRIIVAWLMQAIMLARHTPLPKGWPTIIIWAGLRGAVSLAAALSLPLQFPSRTLLLTLTFGIVLFTLLAQGTTIRPLLARLGIGQPPRSLDYERIVGQLRAVEAAHRELRQVCTEYGVDTHVAVQLLAQYDQRLQDLREQLDQLFHHDPSLAAEQTRVVQQRLFHIQRETIQALVGQGQLGEGAAREILANLDQRLLELDMTQEVVMTPDG